MEVWELRAWLDYMQIHRWEAELEAKRLGTTYHPNCQSEHNSLLWENTLLSCKKFFHSFVQMWANGLHLWKLLTGGNLWYSQWITTPTGGLPVRCTCRHSCCTGSLGQLSRTQGCSGLGAWSALLMCTLVYIHAPGVVGASWDQCKLQECETGPVYITRTGPTRTAWPPSWKLGIEAARAMALLKGLMGRAFFPPSACLGD